MPSQLGAAHVAHDLHEMRLAHPALAHQHRRARLAVCQVRQVLVEHAQLVLAAERRQRPRGARLRQPFRFRRFARGACASPISGEVGTRALKVGPEDGHGLSLALDLDRLERSVEGARLIRRDRTRRGCVRLLVDQHALDLGLARRLHQPRGQVDLVAAERVLTPHRRPSLTAEDAPRRDARRAVEHPRRVFAGHRASLDRSQRARHLKR
mmetsp:Transcript_34053/g.74743  ORF Transcript_34053/g.74743 Transcript_34053/m.74743 type:complete len:210 (+) Transcript_34053:431-1060(+)|eukprot:5978098-Pleurochrysis_carterae.AAC.3